MYRLFWGNTWRTPFSPGLSRLPEVRASGWEDEDVLPGSPFMTWPTEDSFEFLVRAEYIRMYDFVEDHLVRSRKTKLRAL